MERRRFSTFTYPSESNLSKVTEKRVKRGWENSVIFIVYLNQVTLSVKTQNSL